MSTLGISRDVLGQFSDWRCILFPSFSFFSLLFPKFFLFPTAHQICLRKTSISDSFTIGSSWNLRNTLKTEFLALSPLGIAKTCQRQEKYPAHRIPVETHNGLSKTMIPVPLTVGFSWNFDMWFAIQLRTVSLLGFVI